MTLQSDNGATDGHATLSVRRFSSVELMTAPEFSGLVAEYAAEVANIDGMPAPDAKLGAYLHLESMGMLHVFGATYGGVLIGFIAVLVQAVPHYDAPLAAVESIFVAAKHRNTGAGLLLLSQAEDLAREKGAPGPIVSARSGSRLADLLVRLGYVETNRVFFKKVAS